MQRCSRSLLNVNVSSRWSRKIQHMHIIWALLSVWQLHQILWSKRNVHAYISAISRSEQITKIIYIIKFKKVYDHERDVQSHRYWSWVVLECWEFVLDRLYCCLPRCPSRDNKGKKKKTASFIVGYYILIMSRSLYLRLSAPSSSSRNFCPIAVFVTTCSERSSMSVSSTSYDDGSMDDDCLFLEDDDSLSTHPATLRSSLIASSDWLF